MIFKVLYLSNTLSDFKKNFRSVFSIKNSTILLPIIFSMKNLKFKKIGPTSGFEENKSIKMLTPSTLKN